MWVIPQPLQNNILTLVTGPALDKWPEDLAELLQGFPFDGEQQDSSVVVAYLRLSFPLYKCAKDESLHFWGMNIYFKEVNNWMSFSLNIGQPTL